ncbi:hypothetical protein [Nocardia abscessus]|uniref:hypothetical protein n=1 Tax=Nocardia abscessus TaxID=120957 RepID=UPI0024574CD3|nr:hypothetical protein [Nocardia abscessus]
METQTIPAYEMPTDPMRQMLVTKVIKYFVVQNIFDPISGKVLDVRTCAALVTGDDDVLMVADPDRLRRQLAEPETCAALLGRWPDMRVLYQDVKGN